MELGKSEGSKIAGIAAKVPQSRGQRRRDAFVEAARALFVERGYRGTTLDAIIERTGGSRQTIYRAFGDKQGLLSAVIAAVGDPIAADVEIAREDAREPLRRFGIAIVTFWRSTEGRAMNRMVASEGMESPEILETWYSSAISPSIGVLAQHLAKTHASDERDAILLARQFLFLLMGEATFDSIFATEDGGSVEAMVDRSLDLILGPAKLDIS